MSLHRFVRAAPPGLTIAVVIVFAILNGLGIWQWQRLDWKQQLMADLERTQALPPLPLAEVLGQPQPAWRAVILPPCAVGADNRLLMHSTSDGKPGQRLIAACPAGEAHILVDLGFAAEGGSPDLEIPVVVRPAGRLRPLEPQGTAPDNNPSRNDWYWRSPAEMGAALKTPVRDDYFVVLDLAASGVEINGLRQGALTAPLTNRHLEYALTWFALAWTLIAIYAAFVVQRMRRA